MFELFRLTIALLGTLIAGIWDLKTTDIPDKLLFSMIAAGFAFAVLEGAITGDWNALIACTLVSALFGIFAFLMYHAGAWGGGDGALLVAAGSLLPVWPFPSPFDFLPFPLVYFASVFFFGFFYSLFYLIYLLRKNRSAKKCFFKKFSALRIAYVPIIFSLLVFFYFVPFPLFLLLGLVLILAPFVYALSSISEKLFYRSIQTKALRPGDMIGQDIPQLKISKRRIRGLTQKEVTAIRKIRKRVLIRTGVRYGIVFFLALVFLVLSML